MTDQLRRNGSLTEMLAGALRDGAHGLGSVPALLRQVLEEESWRVMVTQRGETVRHERFVDYVRAQPLAGLGSTVELLRRILSGDPVALDLLDRELQNPVGRPKTGNIVPDKPEGNSAEKALRRLRKDRPDLHAEVLAGNLSAHAAAVQAGFRRRTITVPVDSPESIAATLRRQLDAEQLSTLARLLTEG